MRIASSSCEVSLRAKLREDFSVTADFDSGNTFVLQLNEELPNICLRHGKRAVSWSEVDFRFIRRDSEWVQYTAGVDIRFFLAAYRNKTFGMNREGEISTGASFRRGFHFVVFEGKWPLCDKCVRTYKVSTFFGDVSTAFGIIPAAVSYLIFGNTVSERLVPVAGALLFPLWFPFGLLSSFWIYKRSETYIRLDPIDDVTRVRAWAHPNFVAAFESRGTVL